MGSLRIILTFSGFFTLVKRAQRSWPGNGAVQSLCGQFYMPVITRNQSCVKLRSPRHAEQTEPFLQARKFGLSDEYIYPAGVKQ